MTFRRKLQAFFTKLFLPLTFIPIVVNSADNGGIALLPQNFISTLEAQARAFHELHVVFEETRTLIDDTHPESVRTYSITLNGQQFHARRTSIGRDSGSSRKGSSSNSREPNARSLRIIDRAFNGEFVYFADPVQPLHPQAGALSKHFLGDQTDPLYDEPSFSWPYLTAIGLSVPDSIHSLQNYSTPRHSLQEALTNGGNTEIERVGETFRVTVVSPPTSYKEPGRSKRHLISFLLDPAKNWAVLERVESTFPEKATFYRSINSDWKHYPELGVWIPGSCVISYDGGNSFGTPKIPAVNEAPASKKDIIPTTSVLSLKSISFKPSDTEFSLDKTPDYQITGTLIKDRTLPEAKARISRAVSYTIGAKGEELRGSVMSVKAEMSRRGFWLWSMVAAISAAIPIALYFYVRGQKAGRERTVKRGVGSQS